MNYSDALPARTVSFFTKHGEVVKNCIGCGETEHKKHHHK